MARTLMRMTVIACLVAWQPVGACPTCAKAVDSAEGRSSGNLAAAYNASILFMAGMPFAITGFFGVTFWRLTRKRGLDQADGSDACQPSCRS